MVKGVGGRRHKPRDENQKWLKVSEEEPKGYSDNAFYRHSNNAFSLVAQPGCTDRFTGAASIHV